MKKGAYVGTGALILLAIKRDRLRIPLWISSIALATGLLVSAFGTMLPSHEDLTRMAIVHIGHPAMRAFLAPTSGVSLGGFVMMRVSTVIAVTIAIFSMSTVTRHSRENEETGCEEIIGSTVRGRRASQVAALAVAIGANLLLSVSIAVAFIVNGLPISGSFAAGIALGCIGIAFSAITLVTAQLAESSRGSNGIAGLVMATAFLISGVGNMMGEFRVESVELISAWPVWLSPFGWYQQIHAFHQNNWWITLFFVALVALSVKLAFTLNSHRDVGMGVVPTRKGPASASPNLLSPFGLAFRLQRRLIISWSVTGAVFAAVLGAASSELNEQMRGIERADEIFGDIFSRDETFIMTLVGLMASFVAVYVVQSFMRMVSEEADGLTELILSTAVSRFRWVTSHITCSALGTAIILTSLGLGGSVSSMVQTGIRFSKVLEASLIHMPAILVLLGVSILVFGLLPRLSGILSWAGLVVSLMAGPFLGSAFNLPIWVRNLSPFTHTPMPTDGITLAPFLLLVMAVVLSVCGVALYNHRGMRI